MKSKQETKLVLSSSNRREGVNSNFNKIYHPFQFITARLPVFLVFYEKNIFFIADPPVLRK